MLKKIKSIFSIIEVLFTEDRGKRGIILTNFKQRKPFNSKEFIIENDGIRIRDKSIGQYEEWKVLFENISNQIFVKRVNKMGWLYAALVCLVFTLAMVLPISEFDESDSFNAMFWSIACIVCFAVYFIKRQDYKFLICHNDQIIPFISNSPSENDVTDFINIVVDKRNKYLRERYGKIDTGYPIEDQLQRFRRLYEEKIITNEEFENLSRQLMKGTAKDIGFHA